MLLSFSGNNSVRRPVLERSLLNRCLYASKRFLIAAFLSTPPMPSGKLSVAHVQLCGLCLFVPPSPDTTEQQAPAGKH
jgi:hypothetical protein